jgi:hypothetical protein
MKRQMFNLAAAASLALFVVAASLHLWTLDRYELVNGGIFGTPVQLCASGGVLEIVWVRGGDSAADSTWTRDGRPAVRRSNFSGRRYLGVVSGLLRIDSAVLHYLVVPHWMLLLATLVLPCAWLVHALVRARRPPPAGRCVRCGYDLRATPERCPECGQVCGPEATAAAR